MSSTLLSPFHGLRAIPDLAPATDPIVPDHCPYLTTTLLYAIAGRVFSASLSPITSYALALLSMTDPATGLLRSA